MELGTQHRRIIALLVRENGTISQRCGTSFSGTPSNPVNAGTCPSSSCNQSGCVKYAYSVTGNCPKCGQSASGTYQSSTKCSYSYGSLTLSCSGTTNVQCSNCSGTGKVTSTSKCYSCNGSGKTTSRTNCSHPSSTGSAHYYCSNHNTSASSQLHD